MSDAAVNHRNWLELPSDLTASILSRLGPIEILDNAQYVCSRWRNICKDLFIWRSIDMHYKNWYLVWDRHLKKIGINVVDGIIPIDMCSYDKWFPVRNKHLQKICVDAVDRSSGGLIEIVMKDFCTDELLFYISKKSVHLKRLRLLSCNSVSDKGLREAGLNLPFLEELEISWDGYSKNPPEIIDRNGNSYTYVLRLNSDDAKALAIAETMPGLLRLEFVGNVLTNVGLEGILNGCPRLEYLDLSKCFNLVLRDVWQKRFVGSKKALRQPQ